MYISVFQLKFQLTPASTFCWLSDSYIIRNCISFPLFFFCLTCYDGGSKQQWQAIVEIFIHGKCCYPKNTKNLRERKASKRHIFLTSLSWHSLHFSFTLFHLVFFCFLRRKARAATRELVYQKKISLATHVLFFSLSFS